MEGTLIRLTVDHLPGDRDPDPAWLCSSRAAATADEVNRTWQAFLRRSDPEHTSRFLKQQPGWTRPELRDPAAAGRWTWLIIAACAQLHLARTLAAGIRLPWQQPCTPGRLTPARVRRGFRRIRQALPVPASAPKPSRPGPGRPAGSRNQRPATALRHQHHRRALRRSIRSLGRDLAARPQPGHRQPGHRRMTVTGQSPANLTRTLETARRRVLSVPSATIRVCVPPGTLPVSRCWPSWPPPMPLGCPPAP